MRCKVIAFERIFLILVLKHTSYVPLYKVYIGQSC